MTRPSVALATIFEASMYFVHLPPGFEAKVTADEAKKKMEYLAAAMTSTWAKDQAVMNYIRGRQPLDDVTEQAAEATVLYADQVTANLLTVRKAFEVSSILPPEFHTDRIADSFKCLSAPALARVTRLGICRL